MRQTQQSDNQGQQSLQALLANIESDTAPFLVKDLQDLQEKAKRDARQKALHITFFLNDIELALPITSIQEIDHLPTVTPLPNLPPWALGITHVRGEIFSVVELRALFNLPALSVKRSPYYILLADKDMKFGFPVDRVSGIVGFEEQRDKLTPHPLSQSSGSNDLPTYIRGMLRVMDREVAILDGAKLLHASLIHDFMG